MKNGIRSESFRSARIDSWIAKDNIVMHRCTSRSLHSWKRDKIFRLNQFFTLDL